MTISRRGAAFCAGAVLMRVDVFSNLWYETEINHETTSKD
jgi:hypothetical protein